MEFCTCSSVACYKADATPLRKAVESCSTSGVTTVLHYSQQRGVVEVDIQLAMNLITMAKAVLVSTV